MKNKVYQIVLDLIKSFIESQRGLEEKKNVAAQRKTKALLTPGVVAVIDQRGDQLREMETQICASLSTLLFIFLEAADKGLISPADRKQVLAELQKLKDDCSDPDIKKGLESVCAKLCA